MPERTIITRTMHAMRAVWSGTDVGVLIFLCMVLHVSLAVKLAGIVFITLANLKLAKKSPWRQIPWFYGAMALLALVQVGMNAYRGNNYLVLGSLCVVFWLAALLLCYQCRVIASSRPWPKVYNALRVYFVANGVLTILQLVRIMLETGTINPYLYIGQNYHYFASTGDHLRGLSGDMSTVNNILCSFGTFFFLFRRSYLVSLLCFVCVLLTTSNIGNFIIMFLLGAMILVHPNRFFKAMALCYAGLLLLFVVKISPSNLHYLNNKFAQIFKLKEKPINMEREFHIEKDALIAEYLKQRGGKRDTLRHVRKLGSLIERRRELEKEAEKLENEKSSASEEEYRLKMVGHFERLYGDTTESIDDSYYKSAPGKFLSFKETVRYMGSSSRAMLIGAGPGNFSSKLAFKATNLGIVGKYLPALVYVAPEFRENHLKIEMRYQIMSASEHSLLNYPNSVFNQLAGEYGALGLCAFAVLYLGFFLVRFKALSYGRYLVPLLFLFLPFDYWFESLSVTIMFELMIFLDLERGRSDVI